MAAMLKKLNSLTLPWPTDWAELFGAERPLILEIGFGGGETLLHLAQQHPDQHVIGLEISNRCLVKAERSIERLGLDNVRVIHSRAETALHHLFEPGTLHEVHINFPDPWFKNRHGHRRLMQRDTLDALVSRLQPGAAFYLATDIMEYAEMAHELLAATPGLDNCFGGPWVQRMPERVVTKYEGRAAQEGRDCAYFLYRRNTRPAPAVPVMKELGMPHVVLETPLSLDAIRAQFALREYRYGQAHISVNAVYQGDKSLLFDVYVKEPTIDQRVAFILLAREQPQEYTLQLSTLGHPRPTSGIHGAAHLLSEWLLSLHPDSRLLKSKLQPRLDEA